MSEPDDLYTLRAQFWLGHYGMAIEEAKQMMRRTSNKDDCAFFAARASALLQQPYHGETTTSLAIQALQIKNLDQLRSMASANRDDNRLMIVVAQALLKEGHLKEALGLVYAQKTLEHSLTCLQIYLAMNRLDLAEKCLQGKDEDSILVQLGMVYLSLYRGQPDTTTLLGLTEQYGISPYLANLTACASMVAGDYNEALVKLSSEGAGDYSMPETAYNTVVAQIHAGKEHGPIIASEEYKRVVDAFDREALKYA